MRRSALPVLVSLLAFGIAWAQPSETDSAGDPRTDYHIGIEDRLRISVWGEQELSMSVRVRPDGMITFPLVNDLLAAGLTTDQVKQEISRRLADYIREPNVTVIVEPSSFSTHPRP